MSKVISFESYRLDRHTHRTECSTSISKIASKYDNAEMIGSRVSTND